MDLPFKANEAAALSDLIVRETEDRVLDDELRDRLASQAGALELATLQPRIRSLSRDPRVPSTLYVAADACAGNTRRPLLLGMSLASLPADGLFTGGVEAGRIRPAGGREVALTVFPFSSSDRENVRAFAEQVDRAFLPRPQGALSAVAAGNRHPEISLPAVFEAFGAILARTGANMASTVQLSATREMTTDEAIAARGGEDPVAAGHTRVSIRHLYHAGLWAAVRTGWRNGYNAEADHFIISGSTPGEIARSVEAAKEAIRHAAGYTKFTTDTSRLFELRADPRHPAAWSPSTVTERFEGLFDTEERHWLLDEFSRPFPAGGCVYRLGMEEIARLAVKFGASLKLNEELFDAIRKVKAEGGQGGAFDFEPSLDEAETLTTPQELLFYMHWLKARGRPAQLVPPNLGFKKRQAYPSALESSAASGIGLRDYAHHKMWPELVPRVEADFRGRPIAELGARVRELAAVARYFDGTLSVHSGSGKQAEVLEEIAKAAGGRVNYKISGELQLQLFDVLYEQPRGSYWRELYERMAARANRFAAAGCFGSESGLAARYTEMGLGSYLGDAARGRVDGNLFLVFWAGNVVGCRDVDCPGGDRRFFKEKLDELPDDLLAEVRRRNARYVIWLADHLQG